MREALLDPAVLAGIQNYALLARNVVEGFVAGLHRSLYHGFGSEFVQYRNYARGDDLKYVDWKAYARLGKHLTKVFQEETNSNCYIVLDASASMAYAGEEGTISKLHYAKIMAACLAYLMNRQGDNVGFYAYSDELRGAIPPAYRSGQVQQVCLELARLEGEGGCDHAKVLGYLAEHFSRRGVVVLISDLLDADEALFKAIRRFRVAHHDCIVFQVLHPDEVQFPFAGPVRFVDSEDGREIVSAPERVRQQYLDSFQRHLNDVERFCRASEVDFLRVTSAEPLASVLAAYLHRREIFK